MNVRLSTWCTGYIAGLAAALSLSAPRAGLAQSKACARTSPSALTLHGVVASGVSLGACMADPAWGRVVPLTLTEGASTANALAGGTISFTYNGGFLYLGFTVTQDGDLNAFDGAVVVFDRTGNGFEDGDFFIRVRPDTTGWGATNPRTSPTGGTACDRSTKIEYYRYSVADGGFIIDETVAIVSAMSAEVAYDYETAVDGETNLWNLEIKIPTGAVSMGGHSYFGITTADFAMGAYMFVDLGANQSGQTGKVLRWPEGIGDRQISQWDLNAPAVSAASLAKMTTNDVCFNMTFAGVPTPWEINGQMAAEGNYLVNPVNQSNTFRVSFMYDGPGDAVTAGSNSGTVTPGLVPFNGSNWDTANEWPATPRTVALPEYNKIYSETFTAPAGTFAQTTTELCSDLRLEGWTRDDYVNLNWNSGENRKHFNHNYFRTSVDTQVIELRGDGIPNLAAGQSGRIVLTINSTNDPSDKTVALSPGERDARGGLVLFAFALSCGVGGIVLRRRRAIAASLGLAGILLIGQGCDQIRRRTGKIGTERWTLLNAGELGLRPLPDEPGWYALPIRKGEVKRMRLVFEGRPLPYQTTTQSLTMALDSATGRPLTAGLPVKAGQVVTVLAFGDIDPDGPNGPLPASSASGAVRTAAAATSFTTTHLATTQYALTNPRYTPSQWVGTLIGSFDGFKTSFVVGTNASFAVPRGAERLTLAVNGAPTDYRTAVGEFVLKFVVANAPTVPTSTAIGFDTPYDSPFWVDPWRVLTATHLYTFYEEPVVNPQTRRTVMARVPLGAAHMSIYESHAN